MGTAGFFQLLLGSAWGVQGCSTIQVNQTCPMPALPICKLGASFEWRCPFYQSPVAPSPHMPHNDLVTHATMGSAAGQKLSYVNKQVYCYLCTEKIVMDSFFLCCELHVTLWDSRTSTYSSSAKWPSRRPYENLSFSLRNLHIS